MALAMVQALVLVAPSPAAAAGSVMTDKNIKMAMKAWLDDAEKAAQTYGQVSDCKWLPRAPVLRRTFIFCKRQFENILFESSGS